MTTDPLPGYGFMIVPGSQADTMYRTACFDMFYFMKASV